MAGRAKSKYENLTKDQLVRELRPLDRTNIESSDATVSRDGLHHESDEAALRESAMRY